MTPRGGLRICQPILQLFAMNEAQNFLSTQHDELWQTIRREAECDAKTEPLLASFLHATVLKHRSLERAVSLNLAQHLSSETLAAIHLREVIDEALTTEPAIGHALRADLAAVRDRDPACDKLTTPLLYYKGFMAIQSHRIGHWLWQNDRQALALFLQAQISLNFNVDIHPAARLGHGLMIDHATGVVIGETAIVGNDVSMLHGVTLGGTGKQSGARHPTIGNGVLIGASATVLGNVKVGDRAKIAAGSVVLKDVPSACTVAGVPAVPVAGKCVETPSYAMDHQLHEL